MAVWSKSHYIKKNSKALGNGGHRHHSIWLQSILWVHITSEKKLGQKCIIWLPLISNESSAYGSACIHRSKQIDFERRNVYSVKKSRKLRRSKNASRKMNTGGQIRAKNSCMNLQNSNVVMAVPGHDSFIFKMSSKKLYSGSILHIWPWRNYDIGFWPSIIF